MALLLFLKTLIFQLVTRKVVPPSDFANRNGIIVMARKSFYAGLIKSRELQAKRYVNGFLLDFDDQTLKARGFDRSTLLREGSSRRGI